MDTIIRLFVCVSAVYVLIWLAGLYDHLVRWRHQRALLKKWRKVHGSPINDDV